MTDIIRIALDRRAQLREEAMKLDMFLRTAEVLLDKAENASIVPPYQPPSSADAPEAADVEMTGEEHPRRPLIRRRA